MLPLGVTPGHWLVALLADRGDVQAVAKLRAPADASDQQAQDRLVTSSPTGKARMPSPA